MELPKRRVGIDTVQHRLRGLEQVPEIARTVLRSMETDEPEDTIEQLIYDGYQELIDDFNSRKPGIHNEDIPHVLQLKELLGGVILPSIFDASVRDLREGLLISRELMLEGQALVKRKARDKKPTEQEVSHAIGAPSVKTHPKALAVGTAGHILERTLMETLKRKGVDTSTWVKDQILWALEELAVLRHAESYTYGAVDDARLFDIFANPPSMGNEAGMGWRKPDEIEKMVRDYQDRENEYKIQLVEAVKGVVADQIDEEALDAFGEDVSAMPYEEALGQAFHFLLNHNLEPEEVLAAADLLVS